MEAFVVREATSDDLDSVIEVQHRAFGRVARRYGIDPAHLPPLQESADDLHVLQAAGGHFFVAIAPSGTIIGSVRAVEHDGTVEVGRLVVDDGWERQGVATALMDALECAFSTCRRYEIFTGSDAADALALYTRRGYGQFDRRQMPGVELVWLEKPGPSAL